MNVLLDPRQQPVIAHRGGGARAPENTIEAMRLGLAAGADALEFDVRLSADGEIVVIHDATVDRTTNGSGAVERMTAAELQSLDAGFRFNGVSPKPETPGEYSIPRFEEVLLAFPETPLLIEVKAPLAAAGTRLLIEKHRAEERCLVDSFSSTALGVFRGSRIACGPGRRGLVALLAKSLLGTRPPVPAAVAALSIPRSYHGVPLPVQHLAATMRSVGKPTHIWTVNDPREARMLWRLGAAGMITDDVPPILAARTPVSGLSL